MAGEETLLERVLPAKPDDLILISMDTWWRERLNFFRLSSGGYMSFMVHNVCYVFSLSLVFTNKHTEINKEK